MENVINALKDKFNINTDNISEYYTINIEPSQLIKVIQFLKDNSFNYLRFLTAIDFPDKGIMELVYFLYSFKFNIDFIIKANLERDNPEIESISEIFQGANWHERETGEMFGIKFINHPDPSPLLLPEGIYAPLRKDFKF
jgi:NADH:ubiquinone oxidoreductase subunit C